MGPVVKSSVPTHSGTHLVHVGRQPIFDRGGEVVAYELLFRGSADAVEAGRRDTYATSHVIVNTWPRPATGSHSTTSSGPPGTSGCSASPRS